MGETITATAVKGGYQEKENGTEKKLAKVGKVPLHDLFKNADAMDVVLMLVGTVGAIAAGMSQVVMTIVFGRMVDAFGGATPSTVLPRVNRVVLEFVYLGIGTLPACFLQISCWTVTGERQANRIRSLYLESVLTQDMEFFDTETKGGQVVSGICADTIVIQEAMGEKVGKFLHLFTTFLGGFVVAFIKGWLLTLVMLSTIPPIIFAAGIVSKMMSKVSSEGLESYSDAGDIVEQTIGSIKTVASFNGEKKAMTLYNNYIKKAYKGTVKEGTIQGFGMGFLTFATFSGIGLILWYGSKLTLSGGYSGADIMSILFLGGYQLPSLVILVDVEPKKATSVSITSWHRRRLRLLDQRRHGRPLAGYAM